MDNTPTYHDLFITTEDIPRTSIFNLGYDLSVTCTHAAGWELWRGNLERSAQQIAGEYAGEGKGLRLDVAGHVIVDSLSRRDG